MKWSFGAVVAFGAAMWFAGPALAAVDAYLQLEGVQGESKDHPGAIDITSWSYETHGGGSAPTGQAASRPSSGEIHITKLNDAASPKLMQAAATGRHFATATLVARKAGGQPYLEYKLENVYVSGYQIGSGCDRPSESMTLNFGKIEIVDQGQTPTHESAVPRGVMAPSAAHLPPPGH